MKSSGRVDALFGSPSPVFAAAIVLRIVLLVYGHYQDEHSALKYTDIDYYIFTDAARYVSQNTSPYTRDTYRYTPLLAWFLLPTTRGGWWFDFGKLLFALSDVLAGYFIYRILRAEYRMPRSSALKYSSVWLLNPMVAQISTRGSSEGVVALLVTALLWATLARKYAVAGVLLGAAVHFKIYPFIYAASIAWWLSGAAISDGYLDVSGALRSVNVRALVKIALTSAFTFIALNLWMFQAYDWPFIEHTFLYHFSRTDHRHNFSPYSTLLYLKSSPQSSSKWHPETLAFVPQLFLTLIALPVALAKVDLPSAMFAQTAAFVTFNKVCTSQYFLWYMVFLPFYLPRSSLSAKPRLGWIALAAWILGQAFWLQQGYQLEFLGRSSFLGLWLSSYSFFAINVWLLGIIVFDIRQMRHSL